MDSRVKRIVILLTSLTIFAVLAIVFVANKRNMEIRAARLSAMSAASVKQEEPAPFKGNLSAWKTDESFFDKTGDTLAGRILEDMKTLVISAVSTERDLRVQILDYQGNLSTGNAFELELRETGSKGAAEPIKVFDEDKDGVVYVKDLAPGEYEVVLQPVAEHNVPDHALKVKVKDKLEYSMIEDISLDIVHESTIDRAKEDRMEQSAFYNTGAEQNTDPVKDMKIGVDLSSADGEVDFVKLYDAGIRFVMLRAGYRGASSGKIIADDMFAVNASNAIRAGLDVGAYFYTQAINDREAVEEASALMLMCSGATITYPLCVRVDRAGGFGRADEINERDRTNYADAFCRTVKSGGYVPMVYSSASWFNTNLEATRLEKYKIWLADYHTAPEYEGYFDMWQYTLEGRVPGIEHEAGLTISYLKESE